MDDIVEEHKYIGELTVELQKAATLVCNPMSSHLAVLNERMAGRN